MPVALLLPMDSLGLLVGALALVCIYTIAWDHRARLETRTHLAELLAVAIRRGRPLPGLFAAIQETGTWRVRRAAGHIHDGLAAGATLADAIEQAGRRTFASPFVCSVRAAEGTPALGEVMRDLAAADLRRLGHHHRICLGLLYPVLLIIAVVLLGGLISRVGNAGWWELGTESALATRELLLWVTLVPAGLFLAGSAARANGWIGRGRRAATRDALRTAGRLLAHGAQVPDAIQAAAHAADHRRLRHAIAESAEQLQSGVPIATAVAAFGLTPAERARAATASPRTLGDLLLACAVRREQEHGVRLGALLRFAHPTAILVAGAVLFAEFHRVLEFLDGVRRQGELW